MACTENGYLINGVDLSLYGFKPIAPIALSGWLDMPARINKTKHDWLDENYTEPYIREDEIFFGGRDLVLKGYISDYFGLNEFLDSIENDAELSCSFGNFAVTVMGFRSVDLCPTDYTEIEIRFRQSVVQAWGTVPATESGGRGINGFGWGDFGMSLLNVDGNKSRGDSKQLPVSVYSKEKTVARKRGALQEVITLMARASDLTELADNIGGLARVLASEGKKLLQLEDSLFREVFLESGFRVTLLRYTSKQVHAKIDISFTEIRTVRELVVFEDTDETNLLGNNHNEALGYIIN